MIWVKKTEDENGVYVDSEEKIYIVEWCHKLYTKERSSIQSFGYEQFETFEDALQQWGLTEKPQEDSYIQENNEQ